MRFLPLRLLVLTLSTPLAAQAQPSDTEAILGTIRTFFEGLTEQDSTKMAGTLEPGARLVQTFTQPDGTPALRTVAMADFVQRIGGYTGPTLLETYWHPQVRVADNLATVWISYAFYVGETLDHCGEDTFQLARTPDGWKILAIADTQRQTGCHDPTR